MREPGVPLAENARSKAATLSTEVNFIPPVLVGRTSLYNATINEFVLENACEQR